MLAVIRAISIFFITFIIFVILFLPLSVGKFQECSSFVLMAVL